MSKESKREWDKLEKEVKKNQLERLKKKEMNKTAAELYAEEQGITIEEASKRLARQLRESMSKKDDERPELRETASQIATKKWIEEGGEESTLKTKFEGRTEQFFNAVDKLFDEMTGKIFTIMEALGFLKGKDFEPPITGDEVKETAIKRLIKTAVRKTQDRIKDKYPNYKDLK